MGTINNFGGHIGKQHGDPSSFNNFGCTIGEQVINNREKPKNTQENDYDKRSKRLKDFAKRMEELAEQIRKNAM